MDNPGIISLEDFTLAGNATQTSEWVEDLEGMRDVTFSARLAMGTGGGTAVLTIYTSLNQGETRIPIARMDFATTGEEQILSVTSASRATPLVVGALGAPGINDGVLGDRLQAEVVTTGTAYAGSSVLSVRASVR